MGVLIVLVQDLFIFEVLVVLAWVSDSVFWFFCGDLLFCVYNVFSDFLI